MLYYPLKTIPCYKTMPWGGQELNELYGKDSPFALTGESWEISDHKNGITEVANGRYAGITLGDLAVVFEEEFLGTRVFGRGGAAFPLLFKLIDARERLSVQVHPNDAYSAKFGDNGKTEMWAVLGADPGAGLYLGFREPLTKAEFARRIAENSLEEALNFVPASPGDTFFLPSGLVHAIGAGLVIAEIQQSSDATYRVYDWGRVGLDGRPRELHIQRALEVADTSLRGGPAEIAAVETDGTRTEYLAACPLFGALRVSASGEETVSMDGGSFHIIFAARGALTVKIGGYCTSLRTGQTAFVPAGAGRYTLSGDFTAYRFFVPDFETDYAVPLRKAGFPESRIRSLFRDAGA